MGIFFIIPLFLLALYILLLNWYKRSWQAIRNYSVKPVSGNTRVTVIVPARNEEHNIGNCIESLCRQHYPAALTELVVVNDHSTDRTAEIVLTAGGNRVQLLNLAELLPAGNINAYKKKGIEMAIGRSKGELIVTTDADCTMDNEWLSTLVSFYEQTQTVFIAAPVNIRCSRRFVEMFQAVDFTTLQGITGAAVHKKTY